MLLTVKNLSKNYSVSKQFLSNKATTVTALTDINFRLGAGRTLGIIGETGSGKTTLAKLLAQLIEPTSGSIHYAVKDTRRGVQLIFQNPYTSLDPRMSIERALREPFIIHRHVAKGNITQKINHLLKTVQLPADCLRRFPDEFSGGQRQRIAIARALAVEPNVLICDEPTASLDLSVQAQILNLFQHLKESLQLSYVFISHNIEVISFIADDVLVLYKGTCVEQGARESVFSNPQHPYTKMLLGK